MQIPETMPNTISLCMITKNEEKYLGQCLESVKDIVDEIIIVDTGSTDKTSEVIQSFAEKFHIDVKFFSFKWVDDFSAARNECIKHATKDWILMIDADELLDEDGIKTIKELVKDKENDAFLFLQKNYTNDSTIAGFVNEENKHNGRIYQGWYGSLIIKLFRNNKGYRFDGTVHELVEPSIKSKKGKIAAANVVLHHYGNADPDVVKKKRQYYLELCKKKVSQKKDAASYYELGILYKENSDFDNALKSFQKAIEIVPNHHLSLFEMGVVKEQQKNYDAAMKYYKESLKIIENSDAFQNLGVCYFRKGMMKEAYDNLKKALLLDANKFTIYNSLGAVLERLGDLKSAKDMLEIATKLNRNNITGFYNLGIVLDKLGDFNGAVENYEKAVALGHKNKEEIKKRIEQLKDFTANDPKYKYSFNVGG